MNRSFLYECLATWFGLGYAPIASGTFGTLGGVLLAALALWLVPAYFLVAMVALAIFLTLVAIPVGTWAEKRWAKKDPGTFVLDEVAGYLVAVAWPVAPGWTHLVVAFFLFRLTDIVKPWPARQMEQFGGGFGIVMDDIMAGLWALLGMILLHQFLPQIFFV